MAQPPRKWVILIPVVLGIASVVMLKRQQETPQQQPPQERPRLVRSLSVPQLDIRPQVRGFGSVRPVNSWEAVAQVRGKVLEKHPQLQKGAILPAGTLLLRIDPADYQLAINQAEADIAAIRAQLLELDIREKNTRASLAIEQAALELSENELRRKRELVGKGGISRSDLEAQERSLLAQQQSVQTQRNSLNLIPSQRALLQAQLTRSKTALESARRDLANTEIRLPFTGRISEVRSQLEQYVREGDRLLAADDLALAEIEAQIPIDQMAGLFRSGRSIDLLGPERKKLLQQSDISAKVRLQQGPLKAEWPARFARLSDTLDPKTRTVGVIVEVEKPYDGVQPGIRPPLVKGLFVEVTLQGALRSGQIIIPRNALHQGRVYLIDHENRLRLRPVEVDLLQPGYAVIRSGLRKGDRLVISDLTPAIEGMLLKPMDDAGAQQRLLRAAGSGETP